MKHRKPLLATLIATLLLSMLAFAALIISRLQSKVQSQQAIQAVHKNDLAAFAGIINKNPQLLVNSDASVESLLNLVIRMDRLEMASLIRSDFGIANLLLCSYLGDVECVSRLIESAGPSVKHEPGSWTAAHAAATRGNLEIIKMLSMHGYNIDSTLFNCWTPQRLAVWNLHPECALLIADLGAAEDPWCDAGLGLLEEIDGLLENHPEFLNKVDCEGNTLLHWACAGGSEAVVQFLIDRGADTTIVNFGGKTPLDISRFRNFHNITAILDLSVSK